MPEGKIPEANPKNTLKFNQTPKMKEKLFSFTINRSLVIALVGLLALGACKSKKKAAAPAPAPAPVETVEQAPPPPPVASAEEVAAEKLENYFNSVAASGNASMANQSIQETLSMFSNQETPVLIVIHEENGIKDYDEPTTIKRYLEYLKDTKKNLNYISDIRLDANGKVSELELRRK
ncbi:histone-lysine N-methyltransferase pr-Set7 [Algoriphagus machipongonensis]|uniref:Histone-lysine N-methyltransferase pr-Set7 n=2 Tax=Algoriphagus machipongonensis TaxID=388413 RepID=A3HRF1_9BACT|nr:histone-lysine N-methyltransferase pr-Set7 [Algoriphagus machipongonensis]